MIKEIIIRNYVCDYCGKEYKTVERNDFQVDLKDNSYCVLGIHNYWVPYATAKEKDPDFCTDCLIFILEQAIKQVEERRKEQ